MSDVKKPRSVICRAEAKKRILDAVARLRPAHVLKWTRISSDVYEDLDNRVNMAIDNLIQAHPSVGKAITVGRKANYGE